MIATFELEGLSFIALNGTSLKVVYSKAPQQLTWSNSRQVKGTLQFIEGILKAPRQKISWYIAAGGW
ncbi:hypothetical protein [Chitinophaga flava]|uniref:Uncharacterized protein n=1 Tax=Chitinophaga flava TaxID=2259036 RepID=A0A365XTB5_9BACT|nr:hypothetical protein [Chitinophaga flava]RBL89358.1 hypothetical protein DF182_22825 [Chitinophaga flava]